MFLFLLFPGFSWAVPANPGPVEISQPDGARISIVLKGDEYYHWHEDGGGYTILKDTVTKNWLYAEKDSTGALKTGKLKVGAVDPVKLGLAKRLFDTPGLNAAKIRRARPGPASPAQAGSGSGAVLSVNPASSMSRAPILAGTLKNLVILAKFSDQTTYRSQAEFDNLFNQTGYATDGAAGSVKDYYLQVSYNKLIIDSVVTAWVTLPHTQAYYGADSGGAGSDIRPREMVVDAIHALYDTGFNFSQVDGNSDGIIDGLTIIHSGRGQEYGGNSTDCIWSHEWNLVSTITYSGVSMYSYHTEPELRGSSGTGITRIGVICHELGHFLGLPDLYDTTNASAGLGEFCLMSGGSWNGNSGTSPAHMSAWCKKTLGWAAATQLTSIGTKSLPAIETSSTALYMFHDSSFPSNEYFLMENRQGSGNFDAYLPGSSRGILIWHIDESMPDNNTPSHYLVDLEEAGGTQHLQTDPNAVGDDSDYFRLGNNTSFTDSSTPNSKSYSNYTLKLPVTSVSATGNPMTFYLGTTDSTPPAAVVVSDGTGPDIPKTDSLTRLSANWTASSDPETGVSGYWYAIGTSAGSADVIDWTDNGTATAVTRSGLSLTDGITYYFGVKAVNGVGVYSNAAWSDGQIVDTVSPAEIPYVYDGTGSDTQFVSSLNTLSANWGASSHSSGITRYEYSIGTTRGGVNISGWISAGLNRSVIRPGLTLLEGTTYYFAVRALNALGSYSNPGLSDGQMVDITSPTAKIEISSPLPAKTGALNLKLVVTEPNGLAGNPALTFTPGSGNPQIVTLSRLISSTWTGSAFIESFYSTGTAAFAFVASDTAGNTGSVITSGGVFVIDTAISGITGGSVVNSDTAAVTVPSGAYAGSLVISISTVPPSRTALADSYSSDSRPLPAHDLTREFTAKTPGGVAVNTFNAPLTIKLCYPDYNNDGLIDGDSVSESLAALYWLDETSSRWTLVPEAVRDAAANCVSALASHFSIYTIRGMDASQFGMDSLKAYPNPCYFSRDKLTIKGIPPNAEKPKIYIYNTAGELVRELSPGDGIDLLNKAVWDGKSKSGQKTASGLYLYLAKTTNYGSGTGKFYIFW